MMPALLISTSTEPISRRIRAKRDVISSACERLQEYVATNDARWRNSSAATASSSSITGTKHKRRALIGKLTGQHKSQAAGRTGDHDQTISKIVSPRKCKSRANGCIGTSSDGYIANQSTAGIIHG